MAAMDVRYEPAKDHLLVVAAGRFDPARCRAAVGEIEALSAQHRLDRVLIDFRAVEDLVSIADRFDLARFLADSKPRARMAILVSAPQRFTSTFEDTAINRGASVRTTASEAEARAFLGLGGA